MRAALLIFISSVLFLPAVQGGDAHVGDLLIVQRPLPGITCVDPCYYPVVLLHPETGADEVLGDHRVGYPVATAEDRVWNVWLAHTPDRLRSRVARPVIAAITSEHQQDASVLFEGYTGAVVTDATLDAFGRALVAVRETDGRTTLYRSDLVGLFTAELRNLEAIRSLEMQADQCVVNWISGNTLYEYDFCYRLGPNRMKVWDEAPLEYTRLPDGGTLELYPDSVRVFDRRSREVFRKTAPAGSAPFSSVSLTPDGSEAWLASTDGVLTRILLENGRTQQTMYVFGAGVAHIAVVGAWTTALDAPIEPRDLEVSFVQGTTVGLRWRELARKATAYEIEYRVGGGAWSLLQTVDPGEETILEDLAARTSYSFRIRTVTPWGNSMYSNLVHAETGSAQTPPASRRRGVRRPG